MIVTDKGSPPRVYCGGRLVLALPSCIGCLGGKKKKGYFIIGAYGEEANWG